MVPKGCLFDIRITENQFQQTPPAHHLFPKRRKCLATSRLRTVDILENLKIICKDLKQTVT